VEEAIYDSQAMRRFVGIDLGHERCATFAICSKPMISAAGCSTRWRQQRPMSPTARCCPNCWTAERLGCGATSQLCRYLRHGTPASIPACPEGFDAGRPASNHRLCIVSSPAEQRLKLIIKDGSARKQPSLVQKPSTERPVEAMPKRQKFGERSGAVTWCTVSGASAGAVLKIPSWTSRSRTPSSRLSV
jgi:hypothetical protein